MAFVKSIFGRAGVGGGGSSRQDVALVDTGDGGNKALPMSGYAVARVLCLFSFQYVGKDFPVALVWWYTLCDDTGRRDEATGMWSKCIQAKSLSTIRIFLLPNFCVALWLPESPPAKPTPAVQPLRSLEDHTLKPSYWKLRGNEMGTGTQVGTSGCGILEVRTSLPW